MKTNNNNRNYYSLCSFGVSVIFHIFLKERKRIIIVTLLTFFRHFVVIFLLLIISYSSFVFWILSHTNVNCWLRVLIRTNDIILLSDPDSIFCSIFLFDSDFNSLHLGYFVNLNVFLCCPNLKLLPPPITFLWKENMSFVFHLNKRNQSNVLQKKPFVHNVFYWI